MDIDDYTFEDVEKQDGGEVHQCTGAIPDAPPRVKNRRSSEFANDGVSTRSTLISAKKRSSNGNGDEKHWYALRTTYGREKKAYEYITGRGTTAFYPVITTVKLIDGKYKNMEESRIPNMFFAYGTEEEIKSFVYDNYHLPYLRFYYCKYHDGGRVIKEPLIVPDNQIESLKIICEADAGDIVISSEQVTKFKTGEKVRIIDGQFKGVVGTVARYHGQQRVGIVITGLFTIATAYVPSAFIKKIQND